MTAIPSGHVCGDTKPPLIEDTIGKYLIRQEIQAQLGRSEQRTA